MLQVTSAQEAATKVEAELANLNSTLKNIEDARPFDQLTVSSEYTVALYQKRTNSCAPPVSAGRRCQGSAGDHQGCREHGQEGKVDRSRLHRE